MIFSQSGSAEARSVSDPWLGRPWLEITISFQINTHSDCSDCSRNREKDMANASVNAAAGVNPIVFFDFTLGGEPLGRVKMELYADITPKTAE